MELARLHAANGDNLVLVARSVSKMEELKAELENAYGIQVMVIGKDLSHPEARHRSISRSRKQVLK